MASKLPLMAHSKEGTGEEQIAHLYLYCEQWVVISQTEMPFSSHHFFLPSHPDWQVFSAAFWWLTERAPSCSTLAGCDTLLCFLFFCFVSHFSCHSVLVFEIILCQTISVSFPGLSGSHRLLSLLVLAGLKLELRRSSCLSLPGAGLPGLSRCAC